MKHAVDSDKKCKLRDPSNQNKYMNINSRGMQNPLIYFRGT